MLNSLKTYTTPPIPEDMFPNDSLLHSTIAKRLESDSGPIEVFLCDVGIHGGWELSNEEFSDSEILHDLNSYFEENFGEPKGYRPWTHAHFLRSIGPKGRRLLTSEIQEYLKRTKFKCPLSHEAKLETGVVSEKFPGLDDSDRKRVATIGKYSIFANRDSILVNEKDIEFWKLNFDSEILKIKPNPQTPVLAVFTRETAYKVSEGEDLRKLVFLFLDQKTVVRQPGYINLEDDVFTVSSDVLSTADTMWENQIWSPQNGQYAGITDSLNGSVSIRRSKDLSVCCGIFFGGHDGFLTGTKFKKWKNNTDFIIELYDGAIHRETFSIKSKTGEICPERCTRKTKNAPWLN